MATIFPTPLISFFLSLIIFTTASETDLLLTFKTSISDPLNSLSIWSNTSQTHFCNWTGITCTKSPPSVQTLNLQNLNLSGEISPSICQLPNLSNLNLANNFFNQLIPLRLSQCTSLQTLNLSNNLLWGTIPDQVSHFSSLKVLDLSKNHLQGQIPHTLASLKSLQVLNLANNWFSGKLPSSVFGNLSELLLLDLSENPFLMSEIPQELGKLETVQQILLQRSNFYGGIPSSFVGLLGLEVLDLSQNNLTGTIPLGLGLGLGKLISLDISQNKLSGSFPTDICLGKGLINLSLHTNFFTGLMPDSLEKCLNLERIQVQNNGFSGDFPYGLWTLPKLKLIRAENNRFSGEIPSSISMAAQLEQIQIDNNSFTGRIPQGLGLISSMYRFSASLNGFYGDLPNNFCDSPVMSIINLSHNSLSGRIPEIKKCRKLVSLSLADNSFTGNIPVSLSELPVLTYIDLSNNNLSGEIPLGLQNLKLALFNVSFNRLSGSVPFSLISGLPASFLQGNPDLCGPGLPNLCTNEVPKKRSVRPTGLICALVSIAFVVGFMIVAAGLFVMCRSSHNKSFSGNWKSVSFYPLRVTQQDLFMGMDERNIVGRGAFGNVYIIHLPSGEFIAVKKLVNVGSLSSKALKTEMKILAKVRHKNMAKLLGFCFSDESIFLIYEYVHNGSLGDMLYGSDFSLEWSIRLQIAMGIARGLAYLHKDYVPRLLHRNIKSNNILLDMDFEPKITDFGLDRIVGESLYQSSMASELNPYYYMAPEHGCSKKATEQMDVYSFGVVLLELITGRKVEEPESVDYVDVVKWVRRKINMINGAYQVLDPKISNSSQQEMLGALEIALRCTSVMPEKRPTMFEVIRLLQSLESKPCPLTGFSISN
ncbi:leucine-rich repeat receptor-like protein kinase family protein [Tasmannia lanceolata]|uniref:leucine-rich repeat receptor-like protein kinase family protein n=1 Tax=Tasmannia lanceolata TaxID=3420 RepID=UPI0040647D62